jgi:AcrR family transcriptional regulator
MPVSFPSMSPMARRSYHSPARQAKAASTRARVIDAARELFTTRGYTGTTVPDIGAAAGVAVETVYRVSDGKAGLLADAVRAAVAGGVDRAQVPVTERPAIRAMIEEPDPARILERYAATQPGIWSRVGPLLRVLDTAADSDPALGELRARLATERRNGLRTGLGRLLEARGALREELDADHAGDIVYAVCGPDTYRALVGDCNWTKAAYRTWLTDTLVDALLTPTLRDITQQGHDRHR